MLRRAGWTQASTLNSQSRAYENTGSDGDWALGHRDSRRSIGILRFDGGSSLQAAPGLHGSMCGGMLDFGETALSSHPRGGDKG